MLLPETRVMMDALLCRLLRAGLLSRVTVNISQPTLAWFTAWLRRRQAAPRVLANAQLAMHVYGGQCEVLELLTQVQGRGGDWPFSRWVKESSLRWQRRAELDTEAIISNPDGSPGIRLTLAVRPTCQRRGQFRLLVEVLPSPFRHCWGEFREHSQPERYYFSAHNAYSEAQLLSSMFHREFTMYGD